MPLEVDGRLFVSAAYGIGCSLMDIQRSEPKAVWSAGDVLSSQYNSAVCFKEHLYGIDGREDVGQAELRCVASTSGEVKWSQPGFGVAHLILAEERLLILRIDGTLVLAEPRADRFVKLAESEVAPNVTRALPALAEGRFVFRDNQQSRGTLYSLQVGQ